MPVGVFANVALGDESWLLALGIVSTPLRPRSRPDLEQLARIVKLV